MSHHSIMKLASNNGQKLLFFPLIYGNHKSCGVICSLTKHLMNPVNTLKECRIVNPIKFYCESNCSEFAKIALESNRKPVYRESNRFAVYPKIHSSIYSQLFFTVIGQTEDFTCVSMCILSILNYMCRKIPEEL